MVGQMESRTLTQVASHKATKKTGRSSATSKEGNKVKRWFLTVDWCNNGKRGIFANKNGNPFSKETQHSEEEMWDILDAFAMILNPQSIELNENELKEYHKFYPLAEYSGQYGIVSKE
jgi:hypothetical protein